MKFKRQPRIVVKCTDLEPDCLDFNTGCYLITVTLGKLLFFFFLVLYMFFILAILVGIQVTFNLSVPQFHHL